MDLETSQGLADSEQTLAESDRLVANRVEAARDRDLAALARDQAADARDLASAQRDAAADLALRARRFAGADVLSTAATQRKQAAKDRAFAAGDRRAAARDRKASARERRRAGQDREALARQLTLADTDPLTGARTRAAGLVDLALEVDRARRTNGPLVVTYIDVVGLKAVNDTKGHAAGDELLKAVVTLVRTHLHSFDLIVRLGGDEFLCAMSDMRLAEARRRFRSIIADLAVADRAIATGFAQLEPGETFTELIERADAELITGRGNHGRRAEKPAR